MIRRSTAGLLQSLALEVVVEVPYVIEVYS